MLALSTFPCSRKAIQIDSESPGENLSNSLAAIKELLSAQLRLVTPLTSASASKETRRNTL